MKRKVMKGGGYPWEVCWMWSSATKRINKVKMDWKYAVSGSTVDDHLKFIPGDQRLLDQLLISMLATPWADGNTTITINIVVPRVSVMGVSSAYRSTVGRNDKQDYTLSMGKVIRELLNFEFKVLKAAVRAAENTTIPRHDRCEPAIPNQADDKLMPRWVVEAHPALTIVKATINYYLDHHHYSGRSHDSKSGLDIEKWQVRQVKTMRRLWNEPDDELHIRPTKLTHEHLAKWCEDDCVARGREWVDADGVNPYKICKKKDEDWDPEDDLELATAEQAAAASHDLADRRREAVAATGGQEEMRHYEQVSAEGEVMQTVNTGDLGPDAL
jgi:hypothetical protein